MIYGNGEIELYGYRFRITPDPIQESLVSVFPGKIIIGDSRRADDPIVSSYVMQDWTGGALKRWMDPSVDFDRFNWSNCATWYSRQLTLNALPRYVNPPAWGDSGLRYVRAGAEFRGVQYIAYNEHLAKLDINETLSDLGTFTGSSNWANQMLVYQLMTGANKGTDRLVIVYGPQAGGAGTGYATYDTSAISAGTGTAIAMVLWDEKLVRVKDDNSLEYTTDLATWYPLPGQNVVPVSTDHITGLAVYPDSFSGLDSLQIATTTGLFYYDDVAQMVRPTRYTGRPRIAGSGKHVTNHYDQLYIPGVGLQIGRYNGDTVAQEGLDQSDGLPAEYQGSLQYLASGVNFLLAAVMSVSLSSSNVQIFPGDEITYATVMNSSQGYATIYGQPRAGGGWHILYSSPSIGTAIYWVGSSSADNKYRMFFGTNGQLGIVDQYPDILNPLDNTIQQFNTTGVHITPWNEMGWSEIAKQAIRQKFGVKGTGIDSDGALCTNGPCKILVEYGLDYDDTTWYTLATITTSSPPAAYFGGNAHTGVSLRAIRYRYTLTRCNNTYHTPVLVWSTLAFLKQMDSRFGYRFMLDLNQPWQGYTPADQADLLRRMCDPEDLGSALGDFRGWVNGKFVDRKVAISELVGKVKGGTKQEGLYEVSLVAFA